jgi:hypothetical protein
MTIGTKFISKCVPSYREISIYNPIITDLQVKVKDSQTVRIEKR